MTKGKGDEVADGFGVYRFCAVASLMGGLQSATQFFASSMQYQPSLGLNFKGVYAPWSIVVWSSSWLDTAPWMANSIREAAGCGIVVSALGLLGVAVGRTVHSNTSKAREYIHGSARWAIRRDIQAAGLLPPERDLWAVAKKLLSGNDLLAGGKALIETWSRGDDGDGVYVGGWVDDEGTYHYLRHAGPEHVLTYAPTRSGKGVGLVVPTLLSWLPSVVVTDLKGELWALSAGWREVHAGNRVMRFEPAAAESIHWNPLDEIRLGSQEEVGDVQNLATLIVDPDGKGLISHWQKTAFALLVGVILHALYKAKHDGCAATLSTVDAMLADPSRPIKALWQEMIEMNHPVVAMAARDMEDRPEEEAGSVLSTAKSYLSLYRDPVVAGNVADSCFRIKDLMNSDQPVSLYIVTQPTDKDRLRPLVRILLNMIVRLLADRMEFKDGRPVASYKHRLLMMLDEFPSLGKLDILQESLAFVAGYGIKCYLICQDLNQLKSRESGYGPDETITSNCHVQNAYPPNRVETAEHLSRLTGQTTIVKEQITTSGRRTSTMLGQVSRTYQEVQRPLLTPDECLRMPGPKKNEQGDIVEPGDMVIYVAGFPAIYGKQPLYFKDPYFSARAMVSAPSSFLRTQPEMSESQGKGGPYAASQ